MEYVMHGPCLTFEIGVSSRLLETLGWRIEGPALSMADDSCSSKTHNALFCLVRTIWSSNADESFRLHARDQLLTDIEDGSDAVDVARPTWNSEWKKSHHIIGRFGK